MIYIDFVYRLSARKQTIVKEWNKSSWRAQSWAKYMQPMRKPSSDKSMMLIKCHLDFQTFCLLHRLHLRIAFPMPSFAFHFFFLLITRFLAVFQLFRVIIAVFLNMAFIAYYPISITEDRNSNDCYISRFLCGFVQCTAQVSPIIPYNIHTYAVYVYNVKPNRFIYRSSKRN